MKKILFVAAACILAAACKPTETETTTASLEVTPTSLSFAAEDTAPQTITVTAVGVEWTYSLAESGKEWVTIERLSDKELTVAVADNTKAEQRTAAVTFKAKDNNRIKDRSVTIIQQGAENPEVYALTVDPTVLTFEAEGAAGQSVKVTASGEGITWSAAIDEAAKEWITLSATEGAEGETTLTVTVQDNPDTAERSANVTLTPSVESVGPKAIRVTQEAKVLPPSLAITYDGGKELPEEGFVMGYRGRLITLALVPVNLTWKAEADAEWLKITVNTDYNLLTIAMSDVLNTSSESRSCNIIVTTDAEGVGPFKIPVTQEGQPEFQSTILEDMELTTLTHCYVAVTPNCDWRDKPFTQWDMRFMSENVSYANNLGNYSGTGDRLTVDLVSEPIWVNDDAEYYLPDGTYTVVANFNSDENLRVPGSVSAGAFTFSHPRFTNGTWYVRIEDDAYPGGQAAITEGTMTVSRTGEEYVITFEFVSDAGFAVTGTYEGTLELHPDA